MVEVPEEICVTVPVTSTREECEEVTREDCDVVENFEADQECDLIRKEVPKQRVCEYRPR